MSPTRPCPMYRMQRRPLARLRQNARTPFAVLRSMRTSAPPAAWLTLDASVDTDGMWLIPTDSEGRAAAWLPAEASRGYFRLAVTVDPSSLELGQSVAAFISSGLPAETWPPTGAGFELGRLADGLTARLITSGAAGPSEILPLGDRFDVTELVLTFDCGVLSLERDGELVGSYCPSPGSAFDQGAVVIGSTGGTAVVLVLAVSLDLCAQPEACRCSPSDLPTSCINA
ncbi:MAG: hypothetical protein ACI9WU_005234 [Myxococcota bacterium]|jgi:hypothetical protein